MSRVNPLDSRRLFSVSSGFGSICIALQHDESRGKPLLVFSESVCPEAQPLFLGSAYDVGSQVVFYGLAFFSAITMSWFETTEVLVFFNVLLQQLGAPVPAVPTLILSASLSGDVCLPE